MATTDVHMNLMPHDYYAGRATPERGLATLAPVISALRAEGNALLFDNGDMLQGNPLADHLGTRPKGHPAMAAMNHLRYDAATLGNHDFGYGTQWLRRVLAQARHPVVSANARLTGAETPWQSGVILGRVMRDEAGQDHALRIGVFGVLPPQTVNWETGLNGALSVSDMLDAAPGAAQALRAQGADLVICLAHSGLGTGQPAPMQENAAAALSLVPGIDAVFAGHAHALHPEAGDGLINGVPVAMAGFGASHLAVIELSLEQTAQGWRRVAANARLIANPGGAADPQIVALTAPAHQATLREIARPVTTSLVPLSSHFVLIGADAGLRLIAEAKRARVARMLAGGPLAELPILSAVAPFRAGGRGGPQHYTHIAPGQLCLSDMAQLYQFTNSLCAVTATGAALRDWLERAASIYQTIASGAQDAPLLRPDFPAYQFDVLGGLDYTIDLTAPAAFDAEGRPTGGRRIRELRHNGQPVAPDQLFVVATNSYRLSGAGLYAALPAQVTHLFDTEPVRDVLLDWAARQTNLSPAATLPFRLSAPGATALFETAPEADPAASPLAATPLGLTDQGFMRMRVAL